MSDATPILFRLEMVRALRAREKRMTRRLLRLPGGFEPPRDASIRWEGGAPWCGSVRLRERFTKGRTLWVREPWMQQSDGIVLYEADQQMRARRGSAWEDMVRGGLIGGPMPAGYVMSERELATAGWRRRNPMFMPRYLSRMSLRVTDVSAQRVHDITEADAVDEGVPFAVRTSDSLQRLVAREATFTASVLGLHVDDVRSRFAGLFCVIHDRRQWIANPLVWVVSLEVLP